MHDILNNNNRKKVFFILNFFFWFVHWFVYLIVGYARSSKINVPYHTLQYLVPYLSTAALYFFFNKRRVHRLYIGWLIIIVVITSLFCGYLYWIARGVMDLVFYNKNFMVEYFGDIELIWISSYMFATWLAIYLGVKIFEDYTIQKGNAEKAALLAKQAELEMLRYQLNPHFLFNTFSSLRALIRKKENDIAEAMVSKMSEFLKYSLLEGDKNRVPLAKEINTVKHYFDIEKVRFGSHLDIEYHIDPRTEHIEIPVFLIHPLVENAVKHGMKSSLSPLKISLKTEQIAESLIIELTNSGAWIDRSPQQMAHRTGLQNTRKRLELAYPERHQFLINKNENSVQIKIIID